MQSGSTVRKSPGFSYIGILIIVAIAAIGMQGASLLWRHEAQRSNEALLLETGEAYRLAIGRYYESTPGAIKQYPPNLQVLLEDKRFPIPKRYLRRPLPDPFDPHQPMTTIMQQGRVIGVSSASRLKPIRQKGYLGVEKDFKKAKEYREWSFIYESSTLETLEQAIFDAFT